MRERIITVLAIVVVVLGTSGIAYFYYDQWRGELGFSDAQDLYENGSHRSAFTLFRRLAQSGHLEAQRYLAHQYEHGEGTDRDMVEAFHWRLRLADQDDAYSMYWVARSYDHGTGAATNQDRALRWYRSAAQQGQVDAQAVLGAKLIFGQGVTADPVQGLRWLMQAVDAGNAWAMAILGDAHRKALLGKLNLQEALRWCLKSIRGGHFAGYKCTVELLGDEKLPTFDLEQAYVWSLVARHWWRDDANVISRLDDEIHGLLRHRPEFSGPRTSAIVGATEIHDGTLSDGDAPESWLEFERRYRDFESWPIRMEEVDRLRAEAMANDIIARWPQPPITED